MLNLKVLGQKLNGWVAAAKQQVKDLWNTYRVYIVGAAGVFLFLKFRDLIISLLVNSGNRVMDSTKEQDAALAKQEDAAKAQAAALQQQVTQEETAPKPPVADDWYEKKS